MSKILRSWGADRDGSVSTIFAFSLIPILLLVGGAVDYTRALTLKTTLQQATDATALTLAHVISQSPSQATLNSDAQAYFAAVVSDPNARITSGPTLSPDNTTVCLGASSNVQTLVMGGAASLGFTPKSLITASSQSCAKINDTVYEIALVLDNSGSMNESTSGTTKIKSLQTAANQLISTMNPPGAKPNATFSIVPFSLAVNVGTQYQNASWMDTNWQSSIHWQNFLLPNNLPQESFLPTSKFDLFKALAAYNSSMSWGGCVEERPAPYMTSDTPASAQTPDSLFVPYFYPDETPNSQYYNYYHQNYGNMVNSYLGTHNGGASCSAGDLYYTADQGTNTDVSNSIGNTTLPRKDGQTMVCKYKPQSATQATSQITPGAYAGFSSGFKTGPNLLCDSLALTTLTNDNSALTPQINAMDAKGSTNLVSGFMWGWRTISPNGPFGSATAQTGSIGPQVPLAYGTKGDIKVMILMTDGYNSWNGVDTTEGANGSTYSPFGFYANGRLGTTNSSNFRTLMDNATLAACTNAKAAGVQIYTVGFSIPSDPIDRQGLTLLQNCATNSSMAYVAQDGSALISTFQSIAQKMSKMRLTSTP